MLGLAALLVQPLEAQAPQINEGGVVNGASFSAGQPVAPGSIASIFGANFGSSSTAVVVRTDGIGAPVFSVSPQQINFQIPWELLGQSQASVTVTAGTATSNSVLVPVASYAPGIFVVSTSGQGAIQIANSIRMAAPFGVLPNSRPATQGEFVSLYCTGLGPTTNQTATGAFARANPLSVSLATPTVTVGGVPATVSFSGLAPNFVGLYQINVQVPPNAPAGDSVVVAVGINGRTSNTVTMAIQGPPPAGALPDLAVSIAAAPEPVTGGYDLTYTVTVRNVGNASAQNVTLSVSSSGGILGSFFLGTLIPGDVLTTSTRTTAPKVKAQTVITTTATVSTTSTESNTINNQATTSSTVNPAPVIQGGGPPGGTILALALDPRNSGTLYAGVFLSGIFKTTDGGANWVAINSGLPSGLPTPPTPSALAVDPSSPSTVYAGDERGFIYKSTNGGGNWVLVRSGSGAINTLVVDPTNSSVVYAGGSFTWVLKSTDGGGSWGAHVLASEIYSSVINSLAIDPFSPATIYAATGAGIYKSTDAGTSWTATNLGITDASQISSLVIANDPAAPGTLYAGGAGLFKSTNAGLTWARSDSGITDQGIGALAIDPSNPATIYAVGSSAIFKTTNKAASWTTVYAETAATPIVRLAIDRASGALYAGTWGAGVFKSVDSSANWAPANSGISGVSITSLSFDPVNLYALAYTGLYRTSNAGLNWTPVPTKFTVVSLAIDPTSPAKLYVGSTGGQVFKSTDSGTTWKASSTGVTGWVYSLAIDSTNSATVYAGTQGSGVLKSTDSGATWAPSATGILTPPQQNVAVRALLIDPKNPATVYAAVDGGSFPGGVYKSTDAGATWSQTGNGFPLNTSCLVFEPGNSSTLYACGLTVYKSTDAGESWIGAGPRALDIYGIAINPNLPGTLFAATNNQGMFKSTDGGATWVYAGLSDFLLLSVAIDPLNPSVVYAGTAYAGVLKSTDLGATWQPTSAK